MVDRFLVTPYALDHEASWLAELAGPEGRLNCPELPEGDLLERLAAVHGPLAQVVATTIGEGERPVVVAGDCCVTLAVAAGLRRAGLAPVLLWLDAHGDFNTWETTPSGFVGGMPLAMLVGRGEQRLLEALGLTPWPETDAVLADARNLDPGEQRTLEASAVRRIGDPRRLRDEPRLAGRPLWVHFDVDVVDPADAPAVGYPAPGGLRAAELAPIFDELGRRRPVAVSMDAWAAERDADGRTREVCLDLLRRLLRG
jgi:arginase